MDIRARYYGARRCEHYGVALFGVWILDRTKLLRLLVDLHVPLFPTIGPRQSQSPTSSLPVLIGLSERCILNCSPADSSSR